MELDNNNHSVFLMYHHLVLVVKYGVGSLETNAGERVYRLTRDLSLELRNKYTVL
ncbi:MAG: hypothetical protein ACYC21_15815 [Eubacteriales bacterium]